LVGTDLLVEFVSEDSLVPEDILKFGFIYRHPFLVSVVDGLLLESVPVLLVVVLFLTKLGETLL